MSIEMKYVHHHSYRFFDIDGIQVKRIANLYGYKHALHLEMFNHDIGMWEIVRSWKFYPEAMEQGAALLAQEIYGILND